MNTTLNYSPNFDVKKRSVKKVKFIIFHYTGMKSEKDSINKLTSFKSKVSCHYFIKNNGAILSIVPDLYPAWHAGVSKWKKHKYLNKNSIVLNTSEDLSDHKIRPMIKELSKDYLLNFDYNVFGVDFKDLGHDQINFQRAWDQIIPEGVDLVNDAIIEGYNMFSKRFGFKSTTATPPNYTWTKEQEKLLFDNGVESLQGILRNRIRNTQNFKYEYEMRYSGLKNNASFQRRNVFFEPSMLKYKEKNISDILDFWNYRDTWYWSLHIPLLNLQSQVLQREKRRLRFPRIIGVKMESHVIRVLLDTGLDNASILS